MFQIIFAVLGILYFSLPFFLIWWLINPRNFPSIGQKIPSRFYVSVMTIGVPFVLLFILAIILDMFNLKPQNIDLNANKITLLGVYICSGGSLSFLIYLSIRVGRKRERIEIKAEVEKQNLMTYSEQVEVNEVAPNEITQVEKDGNTPHNP